MVPYLCNTRKPPIVFWPKLLLEKNNSWEFHFSKITNTYLNSMEVSTAKQATSGSQPSLQKLPWDKRNCFGALMDLFLQHWYTVEVNKHIGIWKPTVSGEPQLHVMLTQSYLLIERFIKLILKQLWMWSPKLTISCVKLKATIEVLSALMTCYFVIWRWEHSIGWSLQLQLLLSC